MRMFQQIAGLSLLAALPTSVLAGSEHSPNHAGVIIGSAEIKGKQQNLLGIEYQRFIAPSWAVGASYEAVETAYQGDEMTISTASIFWYPTQHVKLGIGIGKETITGKHPHSESLKRATLSYEIPFDVLTIAPTVTVDKLKSTEVVAAGIAFSVSF